MQAEECYYKYDIFRCKISLFLRFRCTICSLARSASFQALFQAIAKYTETPIIPKDLVHRSNGPVGQNMIQFDGQCMKKHFSMRIPFDIIGGPVQLLYNGLLLGNVRYLIQP